MKSVNVSHTDLNNCLRIRLRRIGHINIEHCLFFNNRCFDVTSNGGTLSILVYQFNYNFKLSNLYLKGLKRGHCQGIQIYEESM